MTKEVLKYSYSTFPIWGGSGWPWRGLAMMTLLLVLHERVEEGDETRHTSKLMVTQASFLGRLGDLLRSVPCSSDAISRSLKSEMATWFSIFTLHPSLDNPSPSTFLLCDATTPCHWQTRRAHGGSIHPSAPSRVACRVAATSYYILQICLT